jgi:hypothetical protein
VSYRAMFVRRVVTVMVQDGSGEGPRPTRLLPGLAYDIDSDDCRVVDVDGMGRFELPAGEADAFLFVSAPVA